jgi:hypothetical protein
LDAGTYTLTVTTIPDANHNLVTETASVTVSKVDSSVSVPNVVFDYGDSATVIVNVTGATGVTASVNNNKAVVNVNGDEITVSGLDAGLYTLTVTTVVDENHDSATQTADITVNKVRPEIGVVSDKANYDFGDSALINVTLQTSGMVTIELYLNNVLVESVDVHMISEDAIVYVNGSENSTSNPVTDSPDFSGNITSDPVINLPDSSGNSTSVPSIDWGSFSGNASMILVNVSADACTHAFHNLSVGQYTVIVNFNGNNNYLASSANTTFAVGQQSTKTYIAVNDTSYGDQSIVVVSLKDKNNNPMANQPITVTLNGSNYNVVTVSNGQASLAVYLGAGDYYVSATYNGNDDYAGSSANATFAVAKTESEVAIASDKTVYAYGESAKLTITNNVDGTVSIYVNGEFAANITVVNGTGQYTLPNLAAGNYTVDADYAGDSNYLSSSDNIAFTVNRISPQITVTAADITYGENAIVNVELPGDATGSVDLTVNGENLSAQIVGGKAQFTIANLNAGDYVAVATYIGNSKYLPAQNTAGFKVGKVDSSLAIQNIAFNVGSSGSTAVYVAGATISPADIAVDEHPEAVIAYDGQAITVSGLSAGTYTLRVTTTPDENHNAVTKTSTVTVSKMNVNIGVAALDIEFGEDAVITVDISNDATGSIKLTVNNVEYTKAIAGGKAVFTISNLSVGNYNAAVSYPGDAKYLPNDAAAAFKVNERRERTFADLAALIDNVEEGDTLELTEDYINDGSVSSEGITISKPITIDGKGYTLDANGQSRIFNVAASNVKLKDIVFENGFSAENGGALIITGDNVEVENCIFEDCEAENGGSIYWDGLGGKISGSKFTNSKAKSGQAVYSNKDVLITGSEIDGQDTKDAIHGGTVKDVKINGKEFVKDTPSISVQSDDISNGETATVKVTLPGNATGSVSFTLFRDDVFVSNDTAEVINGIATFAYSKLPIDIYKVDVIYSGDAAYNQNAATGRFTVSPAVSILQNVSIGKDGRISIDLIDDEGSIVVLIDGAPVGIETIVNGKINRVFSTENMTARNHTVTFTYYGSKYNENVLKHWNGQKYVPREYNMYIAPKEIVIEDKVESDDGIVILELPKNATGTIDVYVDGMKVKVVTINNGIAKIDLSKYKDGNHVFTFEYSGDDYYGGFTKNVTVHHKVPSITAGNMAVLYTAGGTYTIKVYQDKGVLAKGASVVITLNGKKIQNTQNKQQWCCKL